ncbi:hypothetical protein P7H19_24660 [Paenibacillus larvae]|nr:hypothetical protein [Paenibacillus larvae]MDT2238827.1 hypothetical protein [Paenibacillus larvae]
MGIIKCDWDYYKRSMEIFTSILKGDWSGAQGAIKEHNEGIPPPLGIIKGIISEPLEPSRESGMA